MSVWIHASDTVSDSQDRSPPRIRSSTHAPAPRGRVCGQIRVGRYSDNDVRKLILWNRERTWINLSGIDVTCVVLLWSRLPR